MASGEIEAILAAAENPAYVRVATARILLRQDLVARHAELVAEFEQALEDDRRLNREPLHHDLAVQVQQLEQEMDTERVEFRCRNIGKKAWADLIAAHPPTAAQKKELKGLDHNPDTFPAAAVAAACSEPAMTVEDAARLERSFTLQQWNELWAAVLDANLGGTPKAHPLVGAILRGNGASGGRLTTTEPLAPSSSVA